MAGTLGLAPPFSLAHPSMVLARGYVRSVEHSEIMSRYGIGSFEPRLGSAIGDRFGDCALRLLAFEPHALKLVLNEPPADTPELTAVNLHEQPDGTWLPVSCDYMRFTLDPDDATRRTIDLDREQPLPDPDAFTVAGAAAAEFVQAHADLARAVQGSRFWNV